MRHRILTILGSLIFAAGLVHAAEEGERVVLVEDGQPRATLVVPAEHDHLDIAIEELVEHIEKATGATLPVKTEDDAIEGVKLYLGESKHTRALGIDESTLPAEGFVIKAFPEAVAIVGDTEHLVEGWYEQKNQGNLWAAYRFLEEYLGVRWYLPHRLGIIIPKRETFALAVGTELKDNPDFPIRNYWPIMSMWRHRATTDAFIELDTAASKRHERRQRAANAYGGLSGNHSTYYFHRMYHDRKELFALKADGARAIYPPSNPEGRSYHAKNWHGFIDYANPEALRQMIDDHIAFYEGTDPELKKEWLRVMPGRAPTEFYIPFNPADGMLASQTPEAKKLMRPGVHKGSASNYVFKFGAELARALYEKFPRKRVCSLAYASFAMPPDPEVVGELPPNMIIQIAMLQPMANWKEPAIYDKWNEVVEQWRKLGGDKLHFWQYACWPKLPKVPFFWPGQFQKFYRKHGDYALGAFINGGPPGGIVAMHHLNYYFGLRVLWDVDLDIEAGLREYCELMFGPAADEMFAFHNTLRTRWENTVWDMPVTQRLPSASMLYGKEGTYPAEVIAALRGHLEKAAATGGLLPIEKERIAWTAASHEPFFKQADAIQSGDMPYHYAVELPEAPTVDGAFDDKAWAAAEWLPMNRHMQSGKELDVGSRVKVGWHGGALHLAIDNHEPLMDQLDIGEKTGGRVFQDDCNEIYLDPAASRSDHLVMIYNAAGEEYFRRVADGFKDGNWSPHGATVVHKRLEDRWVAEMSFPMKGLEVKDFDAPTRWVWNVFRNRRASKNNHYIALKPTHSPSTKQFTLYPQLVLIHRPPFYATFDEPYKATKGFSCWHRNLRHIDRFKRGVTMKTESGRFHVRFDPASVIPEEDSKWYHTVSSNTFGSGEVAIPVTGQTAIDVKMRWPGEKPLTVALHGRVKKGGQGEPKFFATGLYRGKSNGEWITVVKKLAGAGGNHPRRARIEPGDEIVRFNLYLTVPSKSVTTAELERVLVGEETLGSVK
jgi:hypothetical protein